MFSHEPVNVDSLTRISSANVEGEIIESITKTWDQEFPSR